MSTSLPRPPLRPRIPYGLSVITLVLLTLGLGAEILILANFFQLNQAAAVSEVSTELLPQLSALRIDVLRLDAETQAIFRTERPDFIALENQRRSAAANLASLRILTIGQAHYQPALDAVDALLRTHDAQLATFQSAPSATQLAALTAELQNSFREAEAALDALALSEEGQFYSATESTLVTVRNIQVILLSASVVILFLGVVLIVTIRQSAQSEISRAYSRLQVAAEVGQAASSILNLDELFATSLNLIRDRFGYYHASIFLLDEQGEQAILRESTGEIGRHLKERGHRLAVGSNSLIGWVTAHHTPRVALDVGEDPLHFKNELLPDTRSELALPLLAGGQLLGALDVHSMEADAFDDVDLGVLQTLADQIAVAIANATQYGSEQARSRQMVALSEAAAELTGPPQPSEVLLDVIARRALKLLRAEGVGLWVPAGADEIELKVAHDLQSAEAVERGLAPGAAPKSNLINHLHDIGRTLRVDDYLAWAGRSDDAMPFETALAVPITWQEAVVGVLTLVHVRPGQVFTAEDKRLAQLFATQAASAIENTRLFAEAERRTAQLAVSAEVARVAASLHALPELLDTTVHLISERFGFYHAGIFLVDDAREWAVLKAANSLGGKRMLARNHRLRVGQQGIVGFVTDLGQPRIALDVGVDAVHFANPDLPETHSEMAVPLTAHGVILGALDVQSVEVNAFSTEDVMILQALADQLGVAIENARLFEETQRNLEELRALQRETRQQAFLDRPGTPPAYRYDGVAITPMPTPAEMESGPASDSLHIPLSLGDEAFGSLEIKREGKDWSDEDIELTRAIANRMALALENARLFEQAQARAQQMATLSEVALELTGPQFSPEHLLDAITRRAMRLLNADGAAIWLPIDEETLELKVVHSPDETQIVVIHDQERLQKGESLAGQVFETGSVIRVDDYPTWPGHKTGPLAQAPFHAALALPLAWQREVLGVLAFTHSQLGPVFTDEDERVATLFASQAAAALENARLLEETQARIAELATINSISQAVKAQLDLNQLIKFVVETVRHTFGATSAYLALYDKGTNLIELRYGIDKGEPIANPPPYPFGAGPSSAIIRSRQPLLINHDAERRMAALGARVTGAPALSYLGVPLLVGEDAIGVISVQSVDQEGLFTEADVHLLSTIAASVGVAIQNVRLFEQTQQRVAELATINNLSQAVSSQLELRALIELVVETVSRTFNSPNAYVALYDSQTNMLQIPYMLEQGKPISVPAFPLGEGVSSVIVKSRQALFVNRDTERYLVGLGAKLSGAPAQSFIGVPMVAGEDVIGVISVQDVEQEGRFTEADVRLLSTIAASVGVAIQNVRLFEESQRRAGQLAALNDLGRAISGELGQEAILRLLAEHIQRLMIVDTFWVALYRLETDTFFFPLRYEAGQYFPPVDGPAQSFSLIQAALQSREPRLILQLAEGESDHAEQHGPAGVLLSHSLILAPLIVGDKTLGVISAQAYAPNAYLSEHLALMVGAAGQTAVALENARLFAETQRRAEQLATAAEVSRASISMLNPDELIVQTVELIRERFDLYYAALFLVDAAGEWAVLRHATGEAGRALLEHGHRLQVGGNSMIGQAAARRQARIALDVGKEPVRFANPLLPDTRSEMALPLAVGEIVLGALSVQSTQPNAFSDDDIAVLQTMADQIAIALRNAQLLSEAQRTQVFLDSVIENLPAMLFVKDARELRFVRWNKAGEELMGLGRAEMIGRNDFDFFSQEEAEFFTSKDREVLTSGTLLDVPEEPIHTRHKGLRFLHTRKIPILDEAGTPQYLLGISEDITERKQVEDYVRFQADILAQVNDAVVATDNEGRVTYWNKGAERFYGITAEAMMGRPLTEAYESPSAQAASATAVAWNDPGAWQGESVHIKKTQELVNVEVSVGKLRNEQGAVVGRLAVIRDITERKQAEAAVRESEAKNRLLLNSIQSPVLALSNDMTILYVNQAYAQLVEATTEALEGQNLLAVFPDFHRTPVYPAYSRAIETGDIQEVEGAIGDRYLRTRVYRTPQGILAIADDITERRRVEEEIIRRNKDLAALNRIVQRRAQQLAAAAEIGRAATSTFNLDALLHTSVELIRDRFGFYHASVFVVEPGSQQAVLRESTGEAGRELKARQHQLAVGSKSLVGLATANREPIIAQDVTDDPNHFKNPLLPDTRAEAVLPLLSGERVIGALDVQSTTPNAFTEDDIAILITIADQLAVAMQNARLFETTARQARREKLVVDITSKIRAASDIDSMLRIAVSELRQALGVSHGAVRLGTAEADAEATLPGNGPEARRGNGSGNGRSSGTARLRPDGQDESKKG